MYASVPGRLGRLGVCSLELDMDVVQFDIHRCTHRILETILNLRHCRVTSKVSRPCDTIAVYVKMTAELER